VLEFVIKLKTKYYPTKKYNQEKKLQCLKAIVEYQFRNGEPNRNRCCGS
jgi:hypothetical protein